MYWVCSSGEKLCNLYCRGEHQHPQVPVGAEQRRQNSHSVLQEREQMVQTFTHTQIHSFFITQGYFHAYAEEDYGWS